MKNKPPNFKLNTYDYKSIVDSLVVQYKELIIPLPLFFHYLVLKGLSKEESRHLLKKLQKAGLIYKSKNFIVVIRDE
jgi:hypothetical protein